MAAAAGAGMTASQKLGAAGGIIGRLARMGRMGHEYWLKSRVSQDLADLEKESATMSLLESAMKNQRFLNRLGRQEDQVGQIVAATGPAAQEAAISKRSGFSEGARQLAALTEGMGPSSGAVKRGARTQRGIGRLLGKKDVSLDAKALLEEIGAEDQESSETERLQNMLMVGMRRYQGGKGSLKRFERQRQGAWAQGLADVLGMLGGSGA